MLDRTSQAPNAQRSGTAAPAIDVRGVSKVFDGASGQVIALDDVSLTVPQGQFMSIVGRSGCGKSTLLRIIAGLIAPSSGDISVMGEERDAYTTRKRLGFVFQDASLLPWKTAAQNIALPLHVTGAVGRGGVQARVEDMLRTVRLDGFGDHFPAQLSGGMRQRVSIARALSYEPEILLMDEPFGALDEFTRREMHEELLGIWEGRPLTVVFVTHSLSEAMALSDKIVVMAPRPGRIRAVVDVATVRPRDRAMRKTAEYIGQRDELEDLLDEC